MLSSIFCCCIVSFVVAAAAAAATTTAAAAAAAATAAVDSAAAAAAVVVVIFRLAQVDHAQLVGRRLGRPGLLLPRLPLPPRPGPRLRHVDHHPRHLNPPRAAADFRAAAAALRPSTGSAAEAAPGADLRGAGGARSNGRGQAPTRTLAQWSGREKDCYSWMPPYCLCDLQLVP